MERNLCDKWNKKQKENSKYEEPVFKYQSKKDSQGRAYFKVKGTLPVMDEIALHRREQFEKLKAYLEFYNSLNPKKDNDVSINWRHSISWVNTFGNNTSVTWFGALPEKCYPMEYGLLKRSLINFKNFVCLPEDIPTYYKYFKEYEEKLEALVPTKREITLKVYTDG